MALGDQPDASTRRTRSAWSTRSSTTRASTRAVADYARKFVPPGKASKAVGAIKRAVTRGLEMDFASGLALERELQQQLFISDDAKEGIAAYVDKRAPAFKGK